MNNIEAMKILMSRVGETLDMDNAVRIGVTAILNGMETPADPEPTEQDPEEEQPKPEPKKTATRKGKPLDVDKMCALRKAGWTLAGIAHEMKCSQQTVANHLKKAGLK